jgi:hypothetical protein
MSFMFRDRANFSTLASVLCFSRQAENKATDDSAKEPRNVSPYSAHIPTEVTTKTRRDG